MSAKRRLVLSLKLVLSNNFLNKQHIYSSISTLKTHLLKSTLSRGMQVLTRPARGSSATSISKSILESQEFKSDTYMHDAINSCQISPYQMSLVGPLSHTHLSIQFSHFSGCYPFVLPHLPYSCRFHLLYHFLAFL